MKKVVLALISAVALSVAVAQNGEMQLNKEYQSAIREWLEQDVAHRGQTMQRRAEQYLVALPNAEKLYDENYISIRSAVVDGTREDGTPTLDYVFDISYNCKHAEGFTDDYPLGVYAWDSSNSVRAICKLTKMFVEGVLDDIFKAGKEVSVRIVSTTDGTDILAPLAYGGEYGDFRYMPTTFNGEPLRLSVDKEHGIQNNAQLAYIRAQSVRWFLENQVSNMRRTENVYQYVTRSYSDTGSHYRRSSIELVVRDAFRETVDLMTADKIQDDYVDFNIPKANGSYDDAYVLIVCNEDYSQAFLPSVPYAGNDAEMVRKYFVQALGVPERQVKVLYNSSKQSILTDGVRWLTDLSQAVAVHRGDVLEPRANLFIYYVGHGYVDFDNKGYMVPNNMDIKGVKPLMPNKKGRVPYEDATGKANYDIALNSKASATLTKQMLGVEELLGLFKGFPVKQITMIVDASFDGHQRNGAAMLHADRKVDPKKKQRKANLRSDAVVLLAADYNKTAYSFDAQHHGFLTYFLLKEIKSVAGNLEGYSYGDIYEAVERKLNKESALQGRWQEASGMAGGKYKDSWRTLPLK